MKRPVLPLLLVGLLAMWLLTGCHPTGTLAPAGTHTPGPSFTKTALPTGTRTATATERSSAAAGTVVPGVPPSPAATHAAPPTPTASPSSAPTTTATPTPPLPPAAAAETGEPLAISLGWRLDANGHLVAAAIDLSGRQPTIYLASLGRSVYNVAGDVGSVRWRARRAGPVYALARLADGRLATGDDAGAVTVLDRRGREVWTAKLASRVTTLCSAPENKLLAGGWDERVSLFDAEGRLQWQVEINAPITSIGTLPVEGTELALVAALDGQLRAFDLHGEEIWGFHAGSTLTTMGTFLAGEQPLALLGLQDGRLVALDGGGGLRWQRALDSGAPVWHAAAHLDREKSGVIAGTGGDSPTLALLSATSGEVRWRIGLPAAVGALTSLDLDGDDQLEILAGLDTGQVQAYDLQGRLRGTVHAGLPVWDLVPTAKGSALILADVVAWQLVGRPGPAGGPWLPAPNTLPAPIASAPSPHQGEPDGGILVFLGDVAFGRSMEAQLARYGPAYPWQGLGQLLHGEPAQGTSRSQPFPVLTVVNLECSLSTRGEPLDKPYLIRAHPQWAQSLVAGGIDLVTLANNHALDFGPAALDETIETLEALDIKAVGAGSSFERAHQPAFLDLGGLRVAFLGYAAARWDGSVDVPATDRLAWAHPGDIEADVEALRDQADIVVVLLHAGTEYATTPSADQVSAAHAAIDAGAHLVVGHHPHVTQTVERYRQGLIVYSLGDAVFDIPRSAAMRGHLLRVRVTATGLASAELWPFWIEGAIQPRLLDGGEALPQVKTIYP